MKRSFSLVFLLSVAMLAFFVSCNKTGGGGSGEKVQLSLNVQPGDVQKIHYTTKQNITQKIMGMSQTIQQTIELYIRQEVESVDENGVATIKVTYERAKSSMENAFTGKQTYDSDSDDGSSPLGAGYSSIIGKTFRMMMDKRSKIVDVSGMDELMDDMWAKMDEMEGTEGEVRKALKSSFGSEAMKRNLQQMALVFPDVLVGEGDTWGEKFKLAGEFGLGVDVTYKVENVDADKVILALEGDVATSDDASIDMGVMKVDYNLSGKQSGTMELDRKTGLVQRSNVTQEFNGEVKAQGMSIPMTISSDITLEPY